MIAASSPPNTAGTSAERMSTRPELARGLPGNRAPSRSATGLGRLFGSPSSAAAFPDLEVGARPAGTEPPVAFAFPPSNAPMYGGLAGMDPRVRDRERTELGLLLLAVGVALLWIPYVDTVGSIVMLVGLILVFLGRRGYTKAHWRSVNVAGGLLVAGFVGTLAATVATFATVAATPNPGETAAQIAATLRSELVTLAVVGAVLGVVVSLGELLLVYQLADATTRALLWAAVVLGVVVSTFVQVYTLPVLESAITQGFSGTVPDYGPVVAAENTVRLWQMLGAGPSLLLAYCFYRVRKLQRAARTAVAPAALPAPP